MRTVGAGRISTAMRALRIAAASLALGLAAHLLGSPIGHDGTFRDLAVLVANVAALFAVRGKAAAGDGLRVVAIAALVLPAILAFEGLDAGSAGELMHSVFALLLLALAVAAGVVALAQQAISVIAELILRIPPLPAPAAPWRTKLRYVLAALARRRRWMTSALLRRGPPLPVMGSLSPFHREMHQWILPALEFGIKKRLRSSLQRPPSWEFGRIS